MLQLPAAERVRLWSAVVDAIERYQTEVDGLRAAPVLDVPAIRNWLARFEFNAPLPPGEALDEVVGAMRIWQVHTAHSRYFGLFNPCPATMGIAADALVAAFNPQIAAWSHNPFAAEVERHLIAAIGAKFGYTAGACDGTFCSGGMEANHTGVLAALASKFPEWKDFGLRGLPGEPVLYTSAESHHSIRKAARLCGLGDASVRLIAVDDRLRLRVDELERQIGTDLSAGQVPFLVAATAGTTNAGAIDPLHETADIAGKYGLWMHVDAAWGGAAALVPRLRPLLAGIECADSITFDAHKWMSVPMGAGLFLTRHPDILDRTFRVLTAYMPKEAEGLDIVDPHLHSMQWSRRFIGLKVFLSLLVAGWEGYEEAIEHQCEMADLLARELAAAGWEIVADSPLAVVCFAAPGQSAEVHRRIAADIVSSGAVWISTTVVGAAQRTVLRACVTNYRTTAEDVRALVRCLG